MPTTSRDQQIAALYAAEHDHLRNLVSRHVHNVDEPTIEDACSHAWTQLLRHPTVDIDHAAAHSILRWLTTTAVRHAWRLCEIQRRTDGVTEHQLGAAAVDTGAIVPSLESTVLDRDRLDLVRQLPERPRRFLLRLMLGYSYHEIAAAENVTYRIVNRQVARGKRLLRQLDENYNA